MESLTGRARFDRPHHCSADCLPESRRQPFAAGVLRCGTGLNAFQQGDSGFVRGATLELSFQHYGLGRRRELAQHAQGGRRRQAYRCQAPGRSCQRTMQSAGSWRHPSIRWKARDSHAGSAAHAQTRRCRARDRETARAARCWRTRRGRCALFQNRNDGRFFVG